MKSVNNRFMKFTALTLGGTVVASMLLGACGATEDSPSTSTAGAAGMAGGTGVAGAPAAGAATDGMAGAATAGMASDGTAGTTTDATAGAGDAAGAGGDVEPPPPGADATALASSVPGVSNEDLGFDAVSGVYYYGDSVTTIAATATAGSVCIEGTGADAGSDYANYGAGFGLQLSEGEDGNVSKAYDASAAAGFSFTITVDEGTAAKIRPIVSMVDQGTAELQNNGFVNGTDDANSISATGSYTINFADLALPSWTKLDVDGDGMSTEDEAATIVFDPTQLHAIQFQIVTVQNKTVPYGFCVTDFKWLDAAGAVIDLPEPLTYTEISGGDPVEMDVAGAGSMDVAGAGGMDEMAGAGMDEMAGAGMDEMAGAGMDEMAGAGMDEMAGAGMDEMAGAGMDETGGAGMDEMGGAPAL